MVAHDVLNLKSAVQEFDLEKENINGVFTNLTLLSMVLTSLTRNRNLLKGKRTFKEEYDYIIVGGGTAGSVMASRLSQKPCVSVLLLEAGGEPPILTDVPSFARQFLQSSIDWEYRTTPQKYSAFLQRDNSVIWSSGRGLGGSSLINSMQYVRGNMRNYDQWAAEGATGWSYKDVLPYFLRLEDNRNIDEVDEGYHRVGGPLTVENINYTPEIKNPILEATAGLGYEQVDVNGRRQTGIYNLQATVRSQQRCSTAKAYLEPASHRPNLDILTHAFARKILIDHSEGKKIAYGVEFDHSGWTHIVRAAKEVIIANGAVRTPQILMLSGIGPKEHLEEFNIPVVADLPVGKNLHDHCASQLLYTVDKRITPSTSKNLDPTNILDYVFKRRGPLTSPMQATLLAFLDGLNTTAYSRDFPRQELTFVEYDFDRPFPDLKEEVYNQVYKPYERKPLYICVSIVLQPHSRGEIALNSIDPYDMPIIEPNYYKDERDIRDVVEGLKICNAVANHPAMRKVRAKLIETQRSNYPNCEGLERDEDQYLECIARQIVIPGWHAVGTARMGSREDPRSVVDPQLRVIGVDNLRVINAAVMPTIISGHTNVPTMMIAEKAYDMMKDEVICDAHFKYLKETERSINHLWDKTLLTKHYLDQIY